MSLWSALATLGGSAIGMPFLGGAVGAGLGALEHGHQVSNEAKDRALRAAEQKYSYATGRDPSTQIRHAGSLLGSVAPSLVSGAIQGGGIGDWAKSKGGWGAIFGGDSTGATDNGLSTFDPTSTQDASLSFGGQQLAQNGMPQNFYQNLLKQKQPTFTSNTPTINPFSYEG